MSRHGYPRTGVQSLTPLRCYVSYAYSRPALYQTPTALAPNYRMVYGLDVEKGSSSGTAQFEALTAYPH